MGRKVHRLRDGIQGFNSTLGVRRRPIQWPGDLDLVFPSAIGDIPVRDIGEDGRWEGGDERME